MSLGVLNNLSAMYAANNLNNTSNSLNTVLQQLSSGSKINSGADDAAGLSLVNGLQANSMALAQSQTNAAEGVGLLKVADGALSQVTNLLNRAVTLATEASNGTLNASQDAAANSEYQSILSEINNIGTTTTYNGMAVFGRDTSIYTGDSSTIGSSINELHIGSLSSSNVGDSGGVMSYSSGSSNVFIDLSAGGTNAALTDSLTGGSTGTTSVKVDYMTKASDGSAVSATATITVGGANSTYANTAQGLISAINGAGLGLNASFGTAAQAGTAAVSNALASTDGKGTADDTGIIITAQGIGVAGAGTDGAGGVGKIVVNGATDALSGTLNIVGSDGNTHAIALGTGNSTDTIANLAATINKAGYGVTATIGGAGNKTLSFTSASSAVSITGTNVTDQTAAAAPDTFTVDITGKTATDGATAGQVGTVTITDKTDLLTGGTLKVTGDDGVILGDATNGITLGVAGQTDTLTNLANYITSQGTATGITASVDSTGTVMTINSAGTTGDDAFTPDVVAGSATDAPTVTTPAVTKAITVGDTPTAGAAQSSEVATFTLAGAGNTVSADGTLTIGTGTGRVITLTAGTTLSDVVKQINSGNYGVTAAADATTAGQINLFSTNSALSGTGNITKGSDAGDTLTLTSTATVPTSSAYYSIGISSPTGINDATTNSAATKNTGLVADSNGSSGTATISYSDAAGQSLSSTDLTNQVNARATLTALNAAITAVAAQDGYIGAQINTLNAVSSVLSTQQQNVVSAQNAVQATDYATAASNMSKYEILSQTGISALAQANSMQQEVTKLLQ